MPHPAPAPAVPARTPARQRRQRSLQVTVAVAVLCAAAMLWLIGLSFQQFVDVDHQRQDVERVQATIGALADNVLVAESSQRGFALTGEERYLERYRTAASNIDALEIRLNLIAGQTPLPATPLEAFRDTLGDVVADLETIRELSDAGRLDAASFAVTSTITGEQLQLLQDRAKDLLGEIQTLIEDKNAHFSRLVGYSRLVFLTGVLAVLLAFVLYIRQRHRLRESDIEHQIALEAERSQLEHQVKERTRDLADLATYLQQTVERERAHLARELHDELGALMTAAKLDVARLQSRLPSTTPDLDKRLEHLTLALNDAIELKRRIMEDLYPSALHNLGLRTALEILTSEFADRSGLTVQTRIAPVELNGETALTAYRLVQEALTNIGKHAQASQVQVSLQVHATRAEIMVQDDGIGFDTTQLPRGAHGLAGMRHRLYACDGTLDIESSPGHGTRICTTIPLA